MSARECLIRHIAATERQKRGSQEEFDPCLACAVHVVDQENHPVVTVKAV